MHTLKITPNLLFEYQCTSGTFIRLPNRIESKKNRFGSENRIESKLFCPNRNALSGSRDPGRWVRGGAADLRRGGLTRCAAACAAGVRAAASARREVVAGRPAEGRAERTAHGGRGAGARAESRRAAADEARRGGRDAAPGVHDAGARRSRDTVIS